MTTLINADTVVGGAVITADASGELALQAAGATKLTVGSGGVTLASALPATSGGTGATTYTTGDVIYASATNTLSKLGIGSSNQVLTVSGGVPAWATPASGALTLLSTSTVSGTPQNLDITWTGTTYDDYLIIAENFRGLNTHRYAFRLADSSGTFQTGAIYYGRGIKWESGSAQEFAPVGDNYAEPMSNNSTTSSTPEAFGYFYVVNANSSTAYASSVIFSWVQSNGSASTVRGFCTGGINWNNASGFRGLRVFDVVTNGLTGGTLRLYGIQK